MPTPVQLELALAGIALARNWLVGDRETVEMIEAEIRRLAEISSNGWSDVPERTVAEGYPEWAPGYDEPSNPVIRLEESVVPALLAESPPGRALDAACGTGRHTARLVELGHDVVGVDGTEAMLSLARTRVPDADFQIGSLTALPLEDGEVDLAVCSLALTHLAELGPAVVELRRVVRPGGRVVVTCTRPSSPSGPRRPIAWATSAPASSATTSTGPARTSAPSRRPGSTSVRATTSPTGVMRSISGSAVSTWLRRSRTRRS